MNLQSFVLAMAPRFEARDYVPSLDASSRSSDIPILHDGTMLVWAGASDRTIYQDAHVNHAFRAWHDGCHILGAYGFTLEHERATCELQIKQALQRFPRIPHGILQLIRAEVIGQAEHFAQFGEFPVDQVEFIRSYAGNVR